MKFGGTSLADGRRIRHAAELVREHHARNRIVVVVSAVGTTTDNLSAALAASVANRSAEVTQKLGELSALHLNAIKEGVRKPELRKRVTHKSRQLLSELERTLAGIAILKEATPRSTDFVLSFGERLSATLFQGVLEDLGVQAKELTGGAAGVYTDDAYGEASVLKETSRLRIKERLAPLLADGILPVVTGFLGATEDGEPTTLGRGGSDYTATILGDALKADEVWIWTDVDGLLTADPHVVPAARTLPAISYAEAGEMVVFGAKGMHPRSLEPLTEKRIPMRIRNTFNPRHPGTLITGDSTKGKGEVVKAIGLMKNVSLINVSGVGMVGKPGSAASIFDVLGKKHINLLMISQSVSEANITMLVKRDVALEAVNALELAFLGKNIIRDVTSEDDVAAIAVIGAGMKGTPGVAARVFATVAKDGINVIMIAQGSSELNISFVVKDRDAATAVKALHREFHLARSH